MDFFRSAREKEANPLNIFSKTSTNQLNKTVNSLFLPKREKNAHVERPDVVVRTDADEPTSATAKYLQTVMEQNEWEQNLTIGESCLVTGSSFDFGRLVSCTLDTPSSRGAPLSDSFYLNTRLLCWKSIADTQ